MKAIATFSRLRQRVIPRQQALYFGLAIVGLWFLIACLAPWIAPFDPIAQDASSSLLPPGGAHLFGTDNFGRDIFSRVLWGAGICRSACWGCCFLLCSAPRWGRSLAIRRRR
jgi:peptide/nickel transport system permease protein